MKPVIHKMKYSPLKEDNCAEGSYSPQKSSDTKLKSYLNLYEVASAKVGHSMRAEAHLYEINLANEKNSIDSLTNR